MTEATHIDKAQHRQYEETKFTQCNRIAVGSNTVLVGCYLR